MRSPPAPRNDSKPAVCHRPVGEAHQAFQRTASACRGHFSARFRFAPAHANATPHSPSATPLAPTGANTPNAPTPHPAQRESGKPTNGTISCARLRHRANDSKPAVRHRPVGEAHQAFQRTVLAFPPHRSSAATGHKRPLERRLSLPQALQCPLPLGARPRQRNAPFTVRDSTSPRRRKYSKCANTSSSAKR